MEVYGVCEYPVNNRIKTHSRAERHTNKGAPRPALRFEFERSLHKQNDLLRILRLGQRFLHVSEFEQ